MSVSRASEQRADLAAAAAGRSVARKTSQVASDAAERRAQHPELGLGKRRPLKARLAISSETVKPMPAMVPPPASAAQPTGGRSAPRLAKRSASEAPTIPSGLPSR